MDIETIKKMLPGEAIPAFDEYLKNNPDDDEAYLMRGLKHWAAGHRSLAINDYLKAISINPESRATQALEAANSILDFYNKDLYNHDRPERMDVMPLMPCVRISRI